LKKSFPKTGENKETFYSQHVTGKHFIMNINEVDIPCHCSGRVPRWTVENLAVVLVLPKINKLGEIILGEL